MGIKPSTRIKKTKSYLQLIPQVLLSLFIILDCIGTCFMSTALELLAIGYPLLILAVCIPPGQMLWINLIENKIFVYCSTVLSAIMSFTLFNGTFTRVLNVLYDGKYDCAGKRKVSQFI